MNCHLSGPFSTTLPLQHLQGICPSSRVGIGPMLLKQTYGIVHDCLFEIKEREN